MLQDRSEDRIACRLAVFGRVKIVSDLLIAPDKTSPQLLEGATHGEVAGRDCANDEVRADVFFPLEREAARLICKNKLRHLKSRKGKLR
jgi:hypothetical protein